MRGVVCCVVLCVVVCCCVVIHRIFDVFSPSLCVAWCCVLRGVAYQSHPDVEAQLPLCLYFAHQSHPDVKTRFFAFWAHFGVLLCIYCTFLCVLDVVLSRTQCISIYIEGRSPTPHLKIQASDRAFAASDVTTEIHCVWAGFLCSRLSLTRKHSPSCLVLTWTPADSQNPGQSLAGRRVWAVEFWLIWPCGGA